MIRPGDVAPDFTLPAVGDQGMVSLFDCLRDSAVLLGLFRGLHCPFCRRQIAQLSTLQEPLARLGVSIVVVVNTPRDRARLYFGHRPARVTLLADADAHAHRLFGLPSVVLDEAFAGTRVNPTGELAFPMHPMEANTILNAKDGFVMTTVDEDVFSSHGRQLAGHFLIGRDRIVRWASVEGDRGVHTIATFPSKTEIIAAALECGCTPG
jgi:peroxiredoxin